MGEKSKTPAPSAPDTVEDARKGDTRRAFIERLARTSAVPAVLPLLVGYPGAGVRADY